MVNPSGDRLVQGAESFPLDRLAVNRLGARASVRAAGSVRPRAGDVRR
jgi:hypothetical protein